MGILLFLFFQQNFIVSFVFSFLSLSLFHFIQSFSLLTPPHLLLRLALPLPFLIDLGGLWSKVNSCMKRSFNRKSCPLQSQRFYCNQLIHIGILEIFRNTFKNSNIDTNTIALLCSCFIGIDVSCVLFVSTPSP